MPSILSSTARAVLSYDIANPADLSLNVPLVIPSSTTTPFNMTDLFTEFSREGALGFAVAISVILVVGIVANILAIVATRRAIRLYRTQRCRKMNIASFLIHTLMGIDLVAVVFFFVRGMLYGVYSSTYVKCDLDLVTNLFFSWAAGFINAIMCLERCIALTAPFYYHCNATVSKAKVAVLVVLVLAFGISILPVLGFGSYKILIDGKYYCIGPGDFSVNVSGFDFEFGVMFLVVGIGIIFFIHVCNVIVIRKIIEIRDRAVRTRRRTDRLVTGAKSTVKQQTSLPSSSLRSREETSTFINTSTDMMGSSESSTDVSGQVGQGARSPARNGRPRRPKAPGKTEINVAKQIVVISVVFTISWLPFYIQRLLKAFDVSQPDWYLLLVVFLLVSNHVVDPFVFVFMKQQSRDALVDLFRKSFCRRKLCPPEDPESVTPAVQNGTRELTPSPQESNCIPPPTPTIITS